MERRAVVVHEERHVAGHLSARVVPAEDEVHREVGHRPSAQVQLADVCLFLGRQRLLEFGRDIDRPGPGIGAETLDEPIRPGRLIGDRYAAAGRPVALALQFQVEPHYELARLAVVDHLGAFEDAALGDVALGVFQRPAGRFPRLSSCRDPSTNRHARRPGHNCPPRLRPYAARTSRTSRHGRAFRRRGS